MASSRNSLSTELLLQAVRLKLAALPHGSKVSIALSGGLDSSVLLHLAARCAPEFSFQFSAIHVHHGLSPHADAWASFCAELCATLDIPLVVVSVTVPQSAAEGLEAAARRLRYAEFAGLDVDYVLLAHHANDQAETLLFNLLRGAGVRGAAAIPDINGRYLRPLLGLTRETLESYAVLHQLRWINDESNANQAFSRNFIRHAVMPVLCERFPAATENLARSAAHFAEAQLMLDELAQQDLGALPPTFPVPVALLEALSEARARNLMRYLLALKGLQAPSRVRLDEFLRQLLNAGPDRHPSLDLPTYRLFRAKGALHLALPHS